MMSLRVAGSLPGLASVLTVFELANESQRITKTRSLGEFGREKILGGDGMGDRLMRRARHRLTANSAIQFIKLALRY
jgi:hypothetical protein